MAAVTYIFVNGNCVYNSGSFVSVPCEILSNSLIRYVGQMSDTETIYEYSGENTFLGFSRIEGADSPDQGLEIGDTVFFDAGSINYLFTVEKAQTGSISIGNAAISKAYIGNSRIDKMYIGNNLIYEKSGGEWGGTDLTGTTWRFNSIVDIDTFLDYGYDNIHITFQSNSTDFYVFRVRANYYDYNTDTYYDTPVITYYDDQGIEILVYANGAWVNSTYREIGMIRANEYEPQWVTDAYFISWLEANATLISW